LAGESLRLEFFEGDRREMRLYPREEGGLAVLVEIDRLRAGPIVPSRRD
jgi:hypothetical protein